ncbi:MAG TPA: hypothetical protein VK233_01190 [Candidatus Dormibacteraeota bacterium]|nr:hypothetical protein [Candidatus Dormibacteraeota bacterium]
MSRICLIAAFVLLLIAALCAFGFVGRIPADGMALLGLAFWALSGAV